MRKNIDDKIKKAYADVLFEKLDNACDLLEYYDNNEEIREFLTDTIKLFNAMHNAHDSRKTLKDKLKRIQENAELKILKQNQEGE